MKKQKISTMLIYISLSCLLLSCKFGTGISHADSLKIKAWDKLFAGTHDVKENKFFFDKTVDPLIAGRCTTAYSSMYGAVSSTNIKTTMGVIFQSDALEQWLTQVTTDSNVKMNNIRIVFGVYTDEMIQKYPSDLDKANKSRLTVFLWPYLDNKPAVYLTKDGGPVSPFNLGSLYP